MGGGRGLCLGGSGGRSGGLFLGGRGGLFLGELFLGGSGGGGGGLFLGGGGDGDFLGAQNSFRRLKNVELHDSPLNLLNSTGLPAKYVTRII